MNIFEQWQNGELTDQEALRLLADEYSEIEQVYAGAAQAREERRNQISEIVAHMGDRASASGYSFQITRPGLSVNYDARALDALLDELEAAGDPLAERLAAMRTERPRSGGLRVVREKPEA